MMSSFAPPSSAIASPARGLASRLSIGTPAAGLALVQRREGCRDDQHVLLLQGNARLAAARRPDALVAGTFADCEALGGVLVGPDVAPAVEPAEFGIPGAGQGRQFDALGDLGAPAVDHAGNAARLQRVGADFVEVAELARLELRRERRRQEDLALLLGDEFADVRRPALELLRLGADAGPLLETVIGPYMDHPVQRADLGVPEGGERRELRPRRERLPEPFFDGRDRARLDGVSTHLDDHRVS